MNRSDVVPLADVSPAAWLSDHLTVLGGRVGNVAPISTYDACVRVLHPADDGSGSVPRSWAYVAEWCGTAVHPLAQWRRLAGVEESSSAARAWPESGVPEEGSLDRETLPRLRDVLLDHAGDVECSFALWDGFGGFPPGWSTAPTINLPGRGYLLFHGDLRDVVEYSVEFACAGLEYDSPGRITVFIPEPGPDPGPLTAEHRREIADQFRATGRLHSPSLWWPEDRSWVVATEIDFDSTLVAGPRTATPGGVRGRPRRRPHLERRHGQPALNDEGPRGPRGPSL